MMSRYAKRMLARREVVGCGQLSDRLFDAYERAEIHARELSLVWLADLIVRHAAEVRRTGRVYKRHAYKPWNCIVGGDRRAQ